MAHLKQEAKEPSKFKQKKRDLQRLIIAGKHVNFQETRENSLCDNVIFSNNYTYTGNRVRGMNADINLYVTQIKEKRETKLPKYQATKKKDLYGS